MISVPVPLRVDAFAKIGAQEVICLLKAKASFHLQKTFS